MEKTSSYFHNNGSFFLNSLNILGVLGQGIYVKFKGTFEATLVFKSPGYCLQI